MITFSVFFLKNSFENAMLIHAFLPVIKEIAAITTEFNPVITEFQKNIPEFAANIIENSIRDNVSRKKITKFHTDISAFQKNSSSFRANIRSNTPIMSENLVYAKS